MVALAWSAGPEERAMSVFALEKRCKYVDQEQKSRFLVVLDCQYPEISRSRRGKKNQCRNKSHLNQPDVTLFAIVRSFRIEPFLTEVLISVVAWKLKACWDVSCLNFFGSFTCFGSQHGPVSLGWLPWLLDFPLSKCFLGCRIKRSTFMSGSLWISAQLKCRPPSTNAQKIGLMQSKCKNMLINWVVTSVWMQIIILDAVNTDLQHVYLIILERKLKLLILMLIMNCHHLI